MPKPMKFQVSVPGASTLPRDAYTNTVHFVDNAIASDAPFVGTDVDALAGDIAAAFEEFWFGLAPARKITVKAYDLDGPPPHDPLVTHVRNPAGTVANINYPGEIALCLSFKGGNRPWQRGRIYLAPQLATGFTGPTSLAPRPPTALMDMALNLGGALSGIGGANIDWVVHSATRGVNFPVTDCWVDDEWDTQRRRGTRPTLRRTRVTGP